MSALTIAGDTSGSITLQAPAVAGSTTINLPSVSGGSFVVSDSSGNVGIGTSSPASVSGFTILTLNNAVEGGAIYLQQNGTNTGAFAVSTGGFTLGSVNSTPLTIITNATERMRVDATGNVTVAKASRGTIATDNDLSFDLNASSNFTCTPSGAGALTFTNIASAAGQSGYILLINTSGVAITAGANTRENATFLSTVSAAGTYLISYFCDGTNVYCTTAGAMI